MRTAIRQLNRALLAAILVPKFRAKVATPEFRSFCAKYGFGILKYLPFGSVWDHQDLWVVTESGFKRNGFFVDVGAADGIGGSTTNLLEKHFGWRGILAEPNPIFFERIAEMRSAPFSPKAVHSSSGEVVEFWQVPGNQGLSTLAAYALNDMHAVTRQQAHVSIVVETISLNDLLGSFGAPRSIDYMNIDTEGSEYDILSAFDFDRYEVRMLTVEHNYSASEQPITNLLEARGYRRVFSKLSRHDAWFVLR